MYRNLYMFACTCHVSVISYVQYGLIQHTFVSIRALDHCLVFLGQLTTQTSRPSFSIPPFLYLSLSLPLPPSSPVVTSDPTTPTTMTPIGICSLTCRDGPKKKSDKALWPQSR
eukprot:GHVS01091242.1.p2 GENE.GHVS01091242.1~~GHVS01091242.1.p2  ORF type:complete len:113 (-),score=10.65 GHVS01091242.1:289-627(-)